MSLIAYIKFDHWGLCSRQNPLYTHAYSQKNISCKEKENVLHDANEKTWTKYMSIEIIKILYGQKLRIYF